MTKDKVNKMRKDQVIFLPRMEDPETSGMISLLFHENKKSPRILPKKIPLETTCVMVMKVTFSVNRGGMRYWKQ